LGLVKLSGWVARCEFTYLSECPQIQQKWLSTVNIVEVILPSIGPHRYHIKERISMASAKHPIFVTPMEFGKTPHRSRSYSGKIAGYV
jgi:hypothetical protein